MLSQLTGKGGGEEIIKGNTESVPLLKSEPN